MDLTKEKLEELNALILGPYFNHDENLDLHNNLIIKKDDKIYLGITLYEIFTKCPTFEDKNILIAEYFIPLLQKHKIKEILIFEPPELFPLKPIGGLVL